MRCVVLVVALALAACHHPPPDSPSHLPPSIWPTAIDWAHPPAPEADPPARDRTIVDHSLPNGLRLVIVEEPRLPLISVATIHRAAGSREDGAQPGLAALTADLLDEGAGALDADTFARQVEAAGAHLDVDIATDYASLHATTLADHLDATLALVAAAIRQPHLYDRDLQRIRAIRIAELAAEDDRPRTVAALAFDRVVFGAHPYGHPAEGVAASVATIGAADCRAFWERAYGPATTTVIVVGGAPAAELERAVVTAFGDWAVLVPPLAPPPHVGPARAPVLAFLDRPGATEAAIVIGKQVELAGGDRLAADVANQVFGGGPGSRLDRRLREELGVTSGAASSFWRGQLGSTWSIVTSTSTSNAARTIGELRALIETARRIEPTPAELARARSLMLRGVSGVFETTAGTTRALERLVVQNRELTFDGYRERIEQITATAARAAIDDAWSQPSIVVVGDWQKLGPALAALGLPIQKL